MVEDILVTARLEAAELAYRAAPQNVSEIVAKTVEHFLRVGVEVKVDCEEARVDVDSSRLEQALRNLLSNAIHHGRPPVEVVGRRSAGIYRLAIIDHGDGLSDEHTANPFAPFAHALEDITTANSLGLGLSVAEALVAMIGGTIDYLRHEGRTVFSLTVPLVAEVDPSDEAARDSSPATIGSRS
jgi:two-component system osmolarity sensor histidine kinase EnvZ